MCGGGGSSPKPVDPAKQAQADIEVMQAEAAMRAEQERERQMREAAEREAAQQAFNQELMQERGMTRGSIDRRLTDRGLDPMEYDSAIMEALDLAAQAFTPDTGVNFSPDLPDRVLGEIRGDKIRGFQRGINEFAPEGFASNRFSDDMDDPFINSILADQYQEASDAVLRARDRGTLDDSGFRYAMDNLGQQRTAAESRLQDTGRGILEGYRGDLRGIADNARTAAGNWDFDSDFDLNHWQSMIDNRAGDMTSGLEGSLRSAVGGEQFFNWNDLINRGGKAAGAQNPGLGGGMGSGLLGAFAERKKKEEDNRGLGSTGAF